MAYLSLGVQVDVLDISPAVTHATYDRNQHNVFHFSSIDNNNFSDNMNSTKNTTQWQRSFTTLLIHNYLSLNPSCFTYSWVISGTSVTVESRQRFLHGFVIFEGSFKKLAGMTLAKVWANLAMGQNSKWLPASILEITFSIIWPTVLIRLCSLEFSGARNSFLAFS